MKPRLQPYGDKNIVGRSIEQLRKQQKITQGDLAKKTHIDPSSFSKLEGQIRVCKDYELLAIAQALQISADALLRDGKRWNDGR